MDHWRFVINWLREMTNPFSTKVVIQDGWKCSKGKNRGTTQVGFNSRCWLHCHSHLRVSRTKIEKLRLQFGEDINFITFRKFVTLLVQQPKNKYIHKNFSTKHWLPIGLFTFFLKFWTNDVTDFPKVTFIISPKNCHLRFSIVVLETFKYKKKGFTM